MLDVNKLLEQNKLAKELVDKGIAKDLDEANEMIEKNKMINGNDFSDIIPSRPHGNNSQEKTKEPQVQSIIDESCCKELKEKIMKLEEKLKHDDEVISKLINFFNDYKSMNDNNLKEVDKRLKAFESNPKEMQNVEPRKVQSNFKKDDDNKDNENKSKYSVENIFNNSHGRLFSK